MQGCEQLTKDGIVVESLTVIADRHDRIVVAAHNAHVQRWPAERKADWMVR